MRGEISVASPVMEEITVENLVCESVIFSWILDKWCVRMQTKAFLNNRRIVDWPNDIYSLRTYCFMKLVSHSVTCLWKHWFCLFSGLESYDSL